ncbi:hypothetical protein D3C81_1809620 [compost metagenome]
MFITGRSAHLKYLEGFAILASISEVDAQRYSCTAMALLRSTTPHLPCDIRSSINVSKLLC